MITRWKEAEAAAIADDPLALRVYTSRLLGADEDLVMHGGGNTSVKVRETDFFGDPVDVLYVKGSGWDLATIEKPGFAPLRLEPTQRLAQLETLTDLDMTKQLRSFLLDPGAPSPSVEAILHAILPKRFVDHTHADAVVTLSNTPNGDAAIRELYPDCLVLPYVMPGFVLSKQVYESIQGVDLDAVKGIILLHHGVFTFTDDARTAYENMIELVDRAERALAEHVSGLASSDASGEAIDLSSLARIRRAASHARGSAQLAMFDDAADARGYASRDDVDSISQRGPITPDHVIRTKRTPVIIPAEPGDDVGAIGAFVAAYGEYFESHASPEQTMLDPAPRAGVWREHGCLAFGSSVKECAIITDIARHTRRAIQIGEQLGGWTALSPAEIFELEYWSLEQAKLAKGRGPRPPHEGKVALVTGAAGGIGRAACEALAGDGATVVGLDIAPDVVEELGAASMTGVVCDVTDPAGVRAAVEHAVRTFGGLDILVCNAGIFRSGETLEAMSDETWESSIDVNLTATRRVMTEAIPYLKLGVDPSLLIVGSRNVTAPGAGAAAYSASKAAVTQLARIAALELAGDGVRVNIVHPDAVFDTGVWTDEALERSAARYGMTVEAYKTKNLLGREISSRDVGQLLSMLAGPVFGATTGAQIPIDGGDPRVV